jgi:ATP diphosphatase
MSNAAGEALLALEAVLSALLGPDGCPWDKEQSADALCEYLAEEMFELVDAVRAGDAAHVREEMGDVLFLLCFLSRRIGEECSLDKVLREAADKLVRRHPHVFAAARCEDREELLRIWEQVKAQEKEEKQGKKSGVFASLPTGLPPMLKAYRVHARAARAAFTWEEDADVEQQVEAEWLEWLDASQSGDPLRMEHELGDLLFTLVELGRRKGIKANAALDKTLFRFLDRFAVMERLAREEGHDFASLDMERKNARWETAKAAKHSTDS